MHITVCIFTEGQRPSCWTHVLLSHEIKTENSVPVFICIVIKKRNKKTKKKTKRPFKNYVHHGQ